MARDVNNGSHFPNGVVAGGGGSRPPVQYYNPQNTTETVYNDYLVQGTAIAVGVNAPDLAVFRNGLYLYAFDGIGAATEQAFFTIHILHDIRQGTTPTLHVHWSHNNGTPSGNVKWQVDVTIAKGYQTDTFGAPVTYTSTQAAAAQYTHHITDDDDMALNTAQAADVEPDTLLIGRIYRDPTDAADTFADDAFLVQIDMHYEIGQVGTLERNRTFTSAGF